ncbi:MAG: tRNA uridine-5-carboxymethylaminomethyl(34) synthesis GTPase MnmE [Spirochaetales bacterium]|nr:MAG: tRNA uridine-5-carboxymethylaminomethyl(34) synthesis GTPase MnmE [Spirochaetales bacterium]
MNDAYHIDDSIAAPATARGRGAVAVIRTSGSECVEMVSRVFSRPDVLLKSKGYRVHYGWINDFSGKPVDEVLVTVFRAPASYTGEDSVEISCHGGPAVVDRILQVLKDAGFRSASPGEFTFRAFSNGKMDLTRAEAVREIIDSRTEKARALALSRLSGAVSAVIDEAKDAVRHQAAAAALALDYAEDETEDVPLEAEGIRKASLSLKALIGTWHTGRLFRDGLRVTLAGPANAGKSSLFNLFLREERSIVAEVPGTTRDWVEAWLNLDGIPLLLADTAGLRSDTADQVEAEGIRRTRRLIEASDIVVLVADGSGSLTQLALLEQEGRQLAEGKLLRVWNKADLGNTPPEGWIPVSALNGQGFKALEKAVRDMALSGESMPDDGAPVIDSMRQKNLLEQAAAAMDRFAEGVGRVSPDLLAEDLRDALDALGELTGEVTREDILETLFSEFCVGK